jgi:hypothetical protein
MGLNLGSLHPDRLWVFENRVLRRIFGRRREKLEKATYWGAS